MEGAVLFPRTSGHIPLAGNELHGTTSQGELEPNEYDDQNPYSSCLPPEDLSDLPQLQTELSRLARDGPATVDNVLMKKFSELKGFTPVSKIIQIDSMTAALRNSLWNVLDLALWSTNGFVYNSHYEPAIEPFSRHLWHDYFKLPIDSRPDMAVDKLKFIRKYFFSCKWGVVAPLWQRANAPMVVAEVCSTMKYPKRSQYKHAKQKKYHVRNWAEYNEGLRRRGDFDSLV